MEEKTDVGWTEPDNFDGQSTIERSQWEYELICRSLKDGNCDDVIRFLLADPRGNNKSSQKNQNVSSLPLSPPHSSNDNNTEIVSPSPSSSSSSSSLAQKSTENSLRRSKSNSSSTSISVDASNSPTTVSSTIDSGEFPSAVLRKPPILPNRCSAVINLDKNRINAKRHRHRTKLLPRPISLPSSFNLLRNFRPPNNSAAAATETIDIELIKQLEDEIYRSRDEVRRPNKIHDANGTCKKCQRRIDMESGQFRPNQVTETKTFSNELKHFNDQQKPLLLLDTWQLQPLLMRRDKMDFCDFYDRQTIRLKEKASTAKANTPRSLLIVDNSKFYPVLMKYEFHENGALIAEPHANVNDALTCDCIENSEQSRDFARLFQIHLNSRLNAAATAIAAPAALDTMEKDASLHFAAATNGNEPSATASPSSAQNCFPFRSVTGDTHQPNATKQMAADVGSRQRQSATKTTRPSRFKRFLMQRRKFNFGLNSGRKRFHHTISNTAIQSPIHSNAAAAAANGDKNSPFQLAGGNNAAVELAKQTANGNHRAVSMFGHCDCDSAMRKLKNPKLNWLLSTKPKVDTFKRRLMMRRRHSSYTERSVEDGIDNGHGGTNKTTDNYSLAYCARFRCICWSCSDLMDISNANYLRTLYMQFEKCCENRERMRRRCTATAAAMPTNVPTSFKNQSARRDVNGIVNSKQKNTSNSRATANNEFVCKRRASSHRAAKRHSVGSATGMTDAVKTWVYRRRCLFISLHFLLFFFLNIHCQSLSVFCSAN